MKIIISTKNRLIDDSISRKEGKKLTAKNDNLSFQDKLTIVG